MRLNGKRVLITAAGQGIGRASAIACAAQGAKVIATDIDATALESLALECSLETQVLDVCDVNAINEIAASSGSVDCLFNCAGIVHEGSVLELSDEDWSNSIEINITSMLRTTRAFLPGMIENAKNGNPASIVNMSSMASSIKGFVNRAAYGATKAAVLGLTKSVAADYVSQGIRCNALCPGTVDTPSLRGRIAQATDPVEAEKQFIARQPMNRLATVDDMTPMLVYLFSDESTYVTGQAISIDGGVTI